MVEHRWRFQRSIIYPVPSILPKPHIGDPSISLDEWGRFASEGLDEKVSMIETEPDGPGSVPFSRWGLTYRTDISAS